MANGADDEDVVIDLSLRDYLSASADRAAREMEDLTRETRRASRALLTFDRRVDKATRSLVGLTAALQKYNLTQHGTTNAIEEAVKTTERYTRSNDHFRRSMERGTRTVQRHDRALRGLTRTLRFILPAARGAALGVGLLTVALGAVALAAGAGGAIGSLFQIVAALSTILSFAGLVPTALGGLLTVVASLVVAFKGLGTAIGAAFSGDTAQLNEALKNLSPNAQKFVKEFMPFVKQLKDIRKVVQDSLFKPLVGALKPFLTSVLPLLKTGMMETAEAFGRLLKDFMDFFRSAEGLKMLQQFFTAGVQMLNAFTKGLKPMMSGFASLVNTVAPYWERFMDVIASGMARFGAWLDAISTDGRLERWLDTAIRTTDDLFAILGLVVDIIGDVARAAGGMGGALAPIVGFLEAIREWTQSAQGQAAMAAFFESMKEIFSALWPVVVVVAEAIGRILAPALADLLKAIAPGFITFLVALSDGLERLEPFWAPLGQAIGELFAALAPLMPVLGDLVGILLADLVRAGIALIPLLGTLAEAFAAFAGPAIQKFAEFAAQLAPKFLELAMDLLEAFEPLIPVIADVGRVVGELIGAYLGRVLDMLPDLMPKLIELADIFAEVLLQALKDLGPYIPTLVWAFLEFSLALIPMTPAILDLANAFLDLWREVEPFMPEIILLTVLFIRLATIIAGAVSQSVQNFRDFVIGAKELKADIEETVEDIKQGFKDAFSFIGSFVVGKIQDIKNAIDNISFANLKEKAKNALAELNPFRAFGGPVEAGVKYTVGEIGPELFVPDHGLPKMIGTTGMETRSFGTDGYIVPSFVLDAMEKMEASVSRQLASVSASSANASDADVLATAIKAATTQGGNTYHFKFEIGSVRSDDDIKKIKKAVKQVLSEIEQDKRERG